ncbi:HTH DNA binding protein [Myxococcus phage Mx8]|uniref:p21 n=1 Tax=Myxococcus phage Mx8 TaxID=49964 RepID=Q94MU8_9CAUD|nr:HTH DNA binding protein [Myxococcus phage Mx8]AAK94356.1 p21 [Myxococcus phage Mx8]
MTCNRQPKVVHYRGKSGDTSKAEWARLRKRALALVDEDWKSREVAEELGVSQDTVSKWVERYRRLTHRRGGCFYGPCKEWGCTAGVQTKHGYCTHHTNLRVWCGYRPRVRRAPGPCANAPSCPRLAGTGQGGAKGLCRGCYQRARRALRRVAEEVGL